MTKHPAAATAERICECGQRSLRDNPYAVSLDLGITQGESFSRSLIMRSIARLIGRDTEISALEGDLDEACNGRGRFVVLLGEAGVGKTRLSEELAARAASRGMATAWGRSWELGGAPDHWPFREALSALARRGAATLVDDVGSDAIYLARARRPAAARTGRDQFA